jgi:hypothetical protein
VSPLPTDLVAATANRLPISLRPIFQSSVKEWRSFWRTDLQAGDSNHNRCTGQLETKLDVHEPDESREVV